MRKEKVQLTKFVGVNLPNVPNFIIHDVVQGGPVPIQMFTERELRKIGKAWTEALVNLAAKRRSQKETKG
jgi:hypothetical protein